MFTLFKKEINSFLSSLIGYVVIIVFLLVNGLFLWVFPNEFNILNFGYANLDGFFVIAPFVFLFLIPAITMRSFAEEKKSGTIEILMTKPLTDLQIIFAKYLAGFMLVIFSLIPTLIYFISVYRLGVPVGNMDMGGTWGSFIGLLFLGAGFVAIGLFSSAITDNQIVAFLIGVVLSGFMYVGFELIYSFSLFGRIDLMIQSLGINAHYVSMSRGVIDTRDVIYFLSVIAIFIILTKLALESRKWNRKTFNRSRVVQLALGMIIVVLINIIGTYFFTRIDLTSEKRYSLSSATKEMLKELDDIVYFKVYLEGNYPAGFKRLSKSTRELLDEFRAHNKKIQYEFINPSKAVDPNQVNAFYEELIRKGLNPTDLQVKTTDGTSQQIIFPGAIVSHKGRELALELLISQMGASPESILNNSIQSLEYNIANVIRKLSITRKPDIAFLRGHGEMEDIYLYDIMYALAEFYNIEKVTLDAKLFSLTKRDTTEAGDVVIKNKFDAIIVAQPDSAFSEKDKFILDQYIIRGGKVLWLIDPVYANMDSLEFTSQTLGIAQNLNLDDMLFKYGVRLNPELILDLNALPIRIVTGMIGDQPQIGFMPWYFFPVITPTSNHPIVNNLNSIKTEFVSSIDIIENEGIKKTVILSTSRYSRKLKTPVLISLRMLEEEPDERLYRLSDIPVAVLLEGKFESVFKNRIPPQIQDDPLIDFLEVGEPGKMIVVSDGDIIRNQLHATQGYPLPLGFDQYTRQSFGNRDFILNALNYLCDDSGLISVRSRELKLRLLDKTKISNNRLMWQTLNTLLPVLIILIFGLFRYSIRKKKYAG